MPLVSILMPTYNGARFLDEQIDSIRAQSIADFELIVIDDGSTDATLDILARRAADDRRIMIQPSSGNIGQTNRLRMLLTRARGQYLSFADQDDVWDSMKTERLLDAIGDGVLAYGRSELIGVDGERLGRTLLEVGSIDPLKASPLRALFEPLFSAHGSLVRREWLDSAAFCYPTPFDWLFGIEAMFSGGARYVDDAVVFHRIHGDNQMNKLDLGKRTRRFTSAQVRRAALSTRAERTGFWLTIRYVGQSPVIDPATRDIFRRFADRLHAAWISEWRSLSGHSREITEFAERELKCFATSAADWHDFDRALAVLNAPPLSRVRLSDIYRRLVH